MYIGCYQDQNIEDGSLRDLDEYINQKDFWRDVTAPRCLGACATLGYTIGALSVSTEKPVLKSNVMKYSEDCIEMTPFFKKNCQTHTFTFLILGPLVPLFWISGDKGFVLGFQSQNFSKIF